MKKPEQEEFTEFSNINQIEKPVAYTADPGQSYGDDDEMEAGDLAKTYLEESAERWANEEVNFERPTSTRILNEQIPEEPLVASKDNPLIWFNLTLHVRGTFKQ